MRIDKFLNSVNITKRRAVAADMLAHNVVFLNGVAVKPAKDVKVGDKIEIKFLESSELYEVLKIPTTKSIPKTDKELYVKRLS